MNILFENLQIGYEQAKAENKLFSTMDELADELFHRSTPKAVLVSSLVAQHAGKLQYFFGAFLDLRKEKIGGTEETQRAEEYERRLSEYFSIHWRNACYLHRQGS